MAWCLVKHMDFTIML